MHILMNYKLWIMEQKQMFPKKHLSYSPSISFIKASHLYDKIYNI
jgi:hypothetical protein